METKNKHWTQEETDELTKLVELCGKNEGVKTFIEMHQDRTEDAVRSKLRALTVLKAEQLKSQSVEDTLVMVETHEEFNEDKVEPIFTYCDPKPSLFKRLVNFIFG